jgi:hypothetical protein
METRLAERKGICCFQAVCNLQANLVATVYSRHMEISRTELTKYISLTLIEWPRYIGKIDDKRLHILQQVHFEEVEASSPAHQDTDLILPIHPNWQVVNNGEATFVRLPIAELIPHLLEEIEKCHLVLSILSEPGFIWEELPKRWSQMLEEINVKCVC